MEIEAIRHGFRIRALEEPKKGQDGSVTWKAGCELSFQGGGKLRLHGTYWWDLDGIMLELGKRGLLVR